MPSSVSMRAQLVGLAALALSCSGGGASNGGNPGGSTGGTSSGGADGASGGGGGHGDGGTPGMAGTTSGGGGGGSGGGNDGGGDAVPSSGCGAAVTPTSGTFTIDVDGTEREYIVTLPSGYDPDHPYPVIFGWHPLGGSAEGVANDGFGFLGGYYGLRARANDSVIFVAGQGLPDQNGNRGWPNTNGRDLAFLDAMLDRFDAELCIDHSRLLSTGFSFGGMMSDLIACQQGSRFRAIAPMAGMLITSYNTCVGEPVAAMLIHGTEDEPVPVDSGRQFRDYLIGTNGCDSASTPVSPSPCVAYQGCDTGYPVTWCEFEGDHTVPNFASAAIWDFFAPFLSAP